MHLHTIRINQSIQRELGSCETLDTQVPESPISLQVYVSRPGHSPSCPLLSTAESSTSPPHLKVLGLRSDRISIPISGDGARARLDSTHPHHHAGNRVVRPARPISSRPPSSIPSLGIASQAGPYLLQASGHLMMVGRTSQTAEGPQTARAAVSQLLGPCGHRSGQSQALNTSQQPYSAAAAAVGPKLLQLTSCSYCVLCMHPAVIPSLAVAPSVQDQDGTSSESRARVKTIGRAGLAAPRPGQRPRSTSRARR